MSRILIAFAVVFTTVTAYAQSGLRDRDPDVAAAKAISAEYQQANFHYDWIYLLSQIRLSDAGYTTTFSLPTAATSDQITLGIEAPHRLYLVPRKKTIFTVDFTPAYAVFRDGGGQFDYKARADAHFLTNHLYVDVYTSLVNQIRAFVSDFNRMATVEENESGVAGEFKYSSRTSAIFSVRHRTLGFPDDRFQPRDIGLEVLERTEDNARLAIHHKTFPVTSLFLSTEVNRYEFDRVASKKSRRSYVGAGFTRDAGRSTLRAEAGPVRLDFDDASQGDYEGVIGSVTGTRTNGRWNFSASAARDLDFSVFAGNPYFEKTTATATVGYASTRRLSLRGVASWEEDGFPNPVAGSRRTDTMSYYGTGLTYAIWKLGLGADVGWFERDSTFGGDLDSGIRWGLHLSLTL